MITQRELEGRLHADAQELDRDFPRADALELRILARVAVTRREERRRLTFKQELALAGLVVVAVALLAVGVGRLRELTRTAPAHPTPSVRSSPGPAASIPFPSTITMVSPTVGWAHAGDEVARTTDGGQTWQLVSPPASANETKAGPVASYFLDEQHGWLVRSIGSPGWWAPARLMILRTADAGRTWTSGDQIPARAFAGDGYGVTAAVFFVDQQRGWLFAEVQTHGPPATSETNPSYDRGLTRSIYTTNDGGQHWSRLVVAPQSGGSVLSTTAVGCEVTGLTFNSGDRGWLTFQCSSLHGPGPSGTVSSVVLVTSDGGKTWSAVTLNNPPDCDATPPIFSANVGVLILGVTPGRCGVYATTDAGRAWTRDQLPDIVVRANFIDGKNGWAVTSNGDVYRTTNSGRTWSRVGRLPAPPNPIAGDIQFLNTHVGFVTTLNWGLATYFRTRDGGRTWTEVQAPPRPTGT